MTKIRPAPIQPRESGLQAEASAVEQLRRKITEMSARGEVASPQLLAEFARAQKAYLDNKIEFEKRRRASEETIPEPAALGAPVAKDERTSQRAAGHSPAGATQQAAPVVQDTAQAGAESSRIWRILGIVTLVAVLTGLAVAAWIFR